MDFSSRIVDASYNNDLSYLDSLPRNHITIRISCVIQILVKGKAEFVHSLFKLPYFINSILNNAQSLKEIILGSNYSVAVLHTLIDLNANLKAINKLPKFETLVINLVKKNLGLGLNVVIQSGLDLTVSDSYGNTALHFAASEGLCSTVKRLCAVAPSTVDQLNSSVLSPLHILLSKGHASCGCLRELLMHSVNTRPCFIHELITAVRCPKLDRHLAVFQLWIECNLLKETNETSESLDRSTTQSMLADLQQDSSCNTNHDIQIALFLVKLAISLFQSSSSNQCLHLIFGNYGLAKWNYQLADSLSEHCGANCAMPLRYLAIRYIRQYLQKLAHHNRSQPMAAHFVYSVQRLPLPSIIKSMLSLEHLRISL